MTPYLTRRLLRFATLSAAVKQLLIAVITLGLCATFSHGAVTLEELRADDQLQVSVNIDTEGTLYQRAPFVLGVEIATARWFSRGTRVRDFRIPGAVVRPVSSFANNSSRRINGETWSVQRWRFRVFPREAGPLELPPLRVFASVNTEQGVVEGELVLNTPPVRVIPPPGAEEYEDWVATTSLTVEENWRGTLDSYLPGDAITRTRRFTVKDAPAMMLPGSRFDDIEGLSVYAAPASVIDNSDRGTLTGVREETLVVTFEAPGSYRLPGLEYAWFNTRTGEFEQLSLPPYDIEVTAASAATSPATGEHQPASSFNVPALISTLVILGITALLWFGRNTAVAIRARGILTARRARRQRYGQYLRALRKEDSVRCVQLLYESFSYAASALRDYPAGTGHSVPSLRDALTDGREGHDSAASRHALETLLEHAYGNGSTLPDEGAAITLWNAMISPGTSQAVAEGLRLNPAPSA